MALTQKQEAFVAKYLECDNATQAYKFAYNAENMSDKTIGNEAYDLLRHPEISPKIKEIREKVLESIVVDRKFVTAGILDTINKATVEHDHSNTLKGYDMLGKMYDLNEDKQNDRLMSNRDKEALLANYRARMLDVTPEGE